jgi:hypothetical protein
LLTSITESGSVSAEQAIVESLTWTPSQESMFPCRASTSFANLDIDPKPALFELVSKFQKYSLVIGEVANTATRLSSQWTSTEVGPLTSALFNGITSSLKLKPRRLHGALGMSFPCSYFVSFSCKFTRLLTSKSPSLSGATINWSHTTPVVTQYAGHTVCYIGQVVFIGA